jgi:hypothetical protein
MYGQLDPRQSLISNPILPYAPAARDGAAESICSCDAEPIDTVTDYDILYLYLKYDKNPTGDTKFEGRGFRLDQDKQVVIGGIQDKRRHQGI